VRAEVGDALVLLSGVLWAEQLAKAVSFELEL